MSERALITDPEAIRLFLEHCTSAEGAVKFTKAGMVSVTGSVTVMGHKYATFYAEYLEMKRYTPSLPDIPAQFIYLPVAFNKVTHAFTISRSPFLSDFKGSPQKTKCFTAIDTPRIKNCEGAPTADIYSFTNVGIHSLQHSRVTHKLEVTRCPLKSLKDLPSTVHTLEVAGCSSIALDADVPDTLLTAKLDIAATTAIDWSLFRNLKQLGVGVRAAQPDADTLRHWVSNALQFEVHTYDQALAWDEEPKALDIKKEPLWRQMLLENCMEPVDFLRVAECFYLLFNESLVAPQAVTETPTFSL